MIDLELTMVPLGEELEEFVAFLSDNGLEAENLGVGTPTPININAHCPFVRFDHIMVTITSLEEEDNAF